MLDSVFTRFISAFTCRIDSKQSAERTCSFRLKICWYQWSAILPFATLSVATLSVKRMPGFYLDLRQPNHFMQSTNTPNDNSKLIDEANMCVDSRFNYQLSIKVNSDWVFCCLYDWDWLSLARTKILEWMYPHAR